MWISKQVARQSASPTVERGKITLTSDGGNVEAAATGVERNVKVYSPYGYAFRAPKGENILLTQGGGEPAVIGLESSCSGLADGEIKISAQSGAYIRLKSDGTAEINGLIISKEGKIIESK